MMDDMSLSPRSDNGQRSGVAKKSRASKPKVKTGCQTCKIRRVKCDETKPFCLRCTKFGHTCDGYAPTGTSRPLNGPSSRALIPRASPYRHKSPDTPPILHKLAPITAAIQPPPSPRESPFHDEEEYRCFQRSCTQTSRQLTSFFTKDLWSRIMLQACETMPALRHAILSIGAPNFTTSKSPGREVGTLRHQFAYRQYSKSICVMRRDVAGDNQDLRTTLIGCLLFYCFESFPGYREPAVSEISSGLRTIREWSTSLYKPDAQGRVRCTLGSENPYIVEDDILRAYGSLELQVMSYVDSRSAELHERYRQRGQVSIDAMPSEFTDLKDARVLLELVVRRSMHWLRSTMRTQDFTSGGDDKVAFKPISSPDSASLFFDVDPSFEEQSATLKEYENWDKAFQPLLKSAREAGKGEKFLLTSTLRLHWLAGYLSVSSNNSRSSLGSGKFTSELSELLKISRTLAEHGEPAHAFDMQLIVPFMTVAWAYRHRALRRQAIDLLLRSPRREGGWDGMVIGRIMTWLAGVEEEGMVSGEDIEEFVPERTTARCISMNFDAGRREAHASCLQPVRGGSIGEEILRDVVIPW